MNEKEWHVMEEDAGTRLDVYLVKMLSLSRSFAQQIVQQGDVWVNGKEAKANHR